MKNNNTTKVAHKENKSSKTVLKEAISSLPRNIKIPLSKKDINKINSCSSMDDVRVFLLSLAKKQETKPNYKNKPEKKKLPKPKKKKNDDSEFAPNGERWTLTTRLQKFREELIERQTPSEKECKKVLDSLGIEYKFQHIVQSEHKGYIVDFYLPKQNIVIEVDGSYHNNDNQTAKDEERTKFLKREGIKEVFRFDNEEFSPETIALTTSKIQKMQDYVFHYYDLVIYAAGFSKSQLGAPGGYAFVALDKGAMDWDVRDGREYTTKNEMDLYSIYSALKFFKRFGIKKVLIYTNSKYCMNELSEKQEGYCQDDFVLIQTIHDKMEDYDLVDIRYVDLEDFHMNKALDLAKKSEAQISLS